MNFYDDLRAAETALDHRLYAAGNALQEGSATQVDATSALRVILLHADPVPEEPEQQPRRRRPRPLPRSFAGPSDDWSWPSTSCWSWSWPSASGSLSGCSGARTSAAT